MALLYFKKLGYVFGVEYKLYVLKQEGIAVGRTFAALKNYQVDGNKEMMAIGIMNVVGSSTSCYVTTGRTFLIKLRKQTVMRVDLM